MRFFELKYPDLVPSCLYASILRFGKFQANGYHTACLNPLGGFEINFVGQN